MVTYVLRKLENRMLLRILTVTEVVKYEIEILNWHSLIHIFFIFLESRLLSPLLKTQS